VGWTAGDGEEVEAVLDQDGRTLRAGGPELGANTSAGQLRALMADHRGISSVYVMLVGEERRRVFPVSNEWRGEIADAAQQEGVNR
jgi:hypothetical protein